MVIVSYRRLAMMDSAVRLFFKHGITFGSINFSSSKLTLQCADQISLNKPCPVLDASKKKVLTKQRLLSRKNTAKKLHARHPVVIFLKECLTCNDEDPDQHVKRMIKVYPQLLSCSVDKKLKPTIEYLMGVICHGGGDVKVKLAQMITRHPQLLGYSVNKNLKPTIEYLMSVICHVGGDVKVQLARMITRFPHLLGYSVNENLKPTIEYLMSVIWYAGGDAKVQLARMITFHPQLLGCSVDKNLKPTIEYLVSVLCKARVDDKKEVALLITRCPSLLGLSVERNINPTYVYLTSVLQYKADDVLKYPGSLTRSLKNRIIPRFAYLKSLNLDTRTLGLMLYTTEETFATKVAGTDLKHYSAFCSSFTTVAETPQDGRKQIPHP